jgi:hypothetical protein
LDILGGKVNQENGLRYNSKYIIYAKLVDAVVASRVTNVITYTRALPSQLMPNLRGHPQQRNNQQASSPTSQG